MVATLILLLKVVVTVFLIFLSLVAFSVSFYMFKHGRAHIQFTRENGGGLYQLLTGKLDGPVNTTMASKGLLMYVKDGKVHYRETSRLRGTR